MDVILHLGAHRTGTRSLQAMLSANAATLQQAQVTVWDRAMTRRGLYGGLLGQTHERTSAQDRRAHRSIGVIRTALKIEARAGTKAVIVAEPDMLGDQRACLRACHLYPDARARLKRLAHAFAPDCRRIVLAVRSYETFWASLIARALPLGAPVPDAAMLDRLVTQPRRWRDVIHDISAGFPRAEILVWPHERMVPQPDRQLALMLGQPVEGLHHETRTWLNRAPDGAMLRQVLTDRGEDIGTIPQGTARWQPFPAPHIAALRGQYHDDLDWLRNHAPTNVTFIDDAAREPRAISEERGQDDDGEKQILG